MGYVSGPPVLLGVFCVLFQDRFLSHCWFENGHYKPDNLKAVKKHPARGCRGAGGAMLCSERREEMSSAFILELDRTSAWMVIFERFSMGLEYSQRPSKTS